MLASLVKPRPTGRPVGFEDSLKLHSAIAD